MGRSSAALVTIAINLSLGANVALLAVKLYAAIASGSLVVIASTLDSVLDLLSGFVVWLSARLSANRSLELYPVGKSRYEPLGIIIFAALMAAASLQIIVAGVQDLAGGPPKPPEAMVATYAILASVVVLKGALYFFCRSLAGVSSSCKALALDHLTDVITNAVPICVLLIVFKYPQAWPVDPAAAILISCWIVRVWAKAALEQVALLTGHAASAEEVSRITFLALAHAPDHVLAVDTVLAYQSGNRLQVELDVVMGKFVPLWQAHDVAEALQHRVERMPEVERCFCHVDYETEHRRDDEHANVYAQYAPVP